MPLRGKKRTSNTISDPAGRSVARHLLRSAHCIVASSAVELVLERLGAELPASSEALLASPCVRPPCDETIVDE